MTRVKNKLMSEQMKAKMLMTTAISAKKNWTRMLMRTSVRNHAGTLMADLVRLGYVPALACLGVTEAGQILNVNADTMAAALAAGLGARRLIIAGGTAGVFDQQGQTIPLLDLEGIDALIGDGTASAGMIAKLRACRAALDASVREVAIVHGRDPKGLGEAAGTRITMEKVHVQRNG